VRWTSLIEYHNCDCQDSYRYSLMTGLAYGEKPCCWISWPLYFLDSNEVQGWAQDISMLPHSALSCLEVHCLLIPNLTHLRGSWFGLGLDVFKNLGTGSCCTVCVRREDVPDGLYLWFDNPCQGKQWPRWRVPEATARLTSRLAKSFVELQWSASVSLFKFHWRC